MDDNRKDSTIERHAQVYRIYLKLQNDIPKEYRPDVTKKKLMNRVAEITKYSFNTVRMMIHFEERRLRNLSRQKLIR